VVSAGEGHVFHNRLTHSLEVAQFGRRLAEKLVQEEPRVARRLGGIDPDVVEAAALAHDIGHPPFGHVAEQELNELVTRAGILGGFEGNAQSFRITTKLAIHSPKYRGLNLTRAVLNAILKYPHLRGTGGVQQFKWGAYHSEEKEFAFARELSPPADLRKSPEATLMDWADDVTYAVHDAADFYRAGLIPLDRLSKDRSERKRFMEGVFDRFQRTGKKLRYEAKEYKTAFEQLIVAFPIPEEYRGTCRHRQYLRDFTAGLIARYLNAVTLEPAKRSGEPRVRIRPRGKEVFMLQQLTWHYVILNPSLATLQQAQRRLIRELFEIFTSAATDQRQLTVFPFGVREEIEGAGGDKELVVRTVADFLSGLTERQVINLHRRLMGASVGSVLDRLTV